MLPGAGIGIAAIGDDTPNGPRRGTPATKFDRGGDDLVLSVNGRGGDRLVRNDQRDVGLSAGFDSASDPCESKAAGKFGGWHGIGKLREMLSNARDRRLEPINQTRRRKHHRPSAARSAVTCKGWRLDSNGTDDVRSDRRFYGLTDQHNRVLAVTKDSQQRDNVPTRGQRPDGPTKISPGETNA